MHSRLVVLVALLAVLLSGSFEQLEAGKGCSCGGKRACSMAHRPRSQPTPPGPGPASKPVPPCHAALGHALEEAAPAPPASTACDLVAGCCQRHASMRAAERPSEPPVVPPRLAGLPRIGYFSDRPAPVPLDRHVPPRDRPPQPFPQV